NPPQTRLNPGSTYTMICPSSCLGHFRKYPEKPSIKPDIEKDDFVSVSSGDLAIS
ncbi:MAG: hypothetical protein GX587_05010, partial [Bacteroidales bacterium]|nr:hypothetical protein [Bacteroidales bacterium]